MKTIILYFVVVLVLSSAVLDAQTITGTWQGTLPVAENARLALRITKGEDGSLRGVYYSVDRGDGAPFSSVSFKAPDFEAAFLFGDLSYRGKLKADGRSMEGTWTQGKQSYPLTLMLASPDTMWKRTGVGGASPMAATANPSFEVATIKLGSPDAKGPNFSLRTRRFAATNRTAQQLIKFAYNLRDREIEGGPSWLQESRFDIAAEPDTAGIPSDDQDRLMLQKLLAERFQLAVHRVQKVMPVYALTVEKSPTALSPSDPETNNSYSIYVKDAGNGQMKIQLAGRTMPAFADVLMDFVPDRQIVDETGLKGKFEITLLMPTHIMSGEPDVSADDRANAFFGAVRGVGLKLVPKRVPVEVLVIDRMEIPTAN